LNVNGIDAHWVLFTQHILTANADMVLIQETHRINKPRFLAWAQKHGYDVYFNCLSRNEKWTDQPDNKSQYYLGTLILLKTNFNLQIKIEHTIHLPHRLQSISLHEDDKELHVFNVYGPSDVCAPQTIFYKMLTKIMREKNEIL